MMTAKKPNPMPVSATANPRPKALIGVTSP